MPASSLQNVTPVPTSVRSRRNWSLRAQAAEPRGGDSMRRLFLILLILAPTNIYAQHESALHADFRQERKRFKKSCPKFSFKAVPGCLEFLVTDHPLHFTGRSEEHTYELQSRVDIVCR